MELTVGSGMVEILWVRTKGQTNNPDVIVGIFYRPSSQDNDTSELFFKELRDTSISTALVLMGDLNLLNINWNTTQLAQMGPENY